MSFVGRTARSYAREVGGNTVLVFALAAVPLIGGTGAALDIYRWQAQKTDMQTVADTAALAGAKAYVTHLYAGKKSKDNAEANAEVVVANYVTAHAPNIDKQPVVTFVESPPSVSVQLSGIGVATLSRVLGHGDTRISVNSTAIATTRSDTACVIGLESSAAPAVTFKGSGSTTATDCAVWSNSTQSPSLVGSSGTATASQFCAVGSVDVSGTTFSVPPKSNCPPVADPFEGVAAPAVGVCDQNDFSSSASGSITLYPGVYCGGMKFSSQASIFLEPGEYIVKDGPFTIVGGSSVDGSEVTIFLTGPGSALKLGGASTIAIKAPKTGDYAGIAIYSFRDSPIDASNIRGSNSLDIEGVIYLPNQDLTFSGSSSGVLPAKYTVLIARTVTFDGSSETVIRSDFGASDVPLPDEVLETRVSTWLKD